MMNATAPTMPTTSSTVAIPSIRRSSGGAVARFHRRSNAPISAPIHMTG